MSLEEKDEGETNSFVHRYFDPSGYPAAPKLQPSSSLIEKFINRIVRTFERPQQAPEQPLAGRIQKILPKIEEILEQFAELEKKYKELKAKHRNQEFCLFFSIVIKPLMREGNQLRASIEKGSETTQARLFSRYVQWMDRSLEWLDGYHRKDKKALEKDLIRHITADTLSYIDKDIQLIRDYEKQQIDKIDLENPKKEKLVAELALILEPLYQEIDSLREMPLEFNLETVIQWQREIEAGRQSLFEQALSEIDDLLQEEIPIAPSEEEHEHLIDVLEKIIELEQLIPNLNYSHQQTSAPQEKRRLMDRIQALQRETHDLSLDLRLSQDLFDRLQEITKSLNIVYRNIQRK